MAGEMISKEELGSVLMEAMLAAKNLRPQRDRLLQLRRRLQQQLRPGDDDMAAGLREFALDVEHINPAFAARLNELAAMRMDVAVTIKHGDLASELSAVYYVGIDPVARPLATCLDLAAMSGARLALNPNPAFADMPDEQLFDALVAQRLPARPTTQAEAFHRVEAAFFAVKLCKEHHLPICIEHLFGIRPPLVITNKHEDNRVDAASEHDTKNSDPSPATGEPPQAAARSSIDHDKARVYLDRACTLASLAVDHIDLAVAVLSGFLDPKEVASISDFTDREAYIAENHFLQITTM
uniref:Uncharacterized protein n=1 Tax=Avena sativa TaxID=4498 RepID=A0ACD5VK07_AVESA